MNILVVTPFANDGWAWLAKHFPKYQWRIINNELFGKNKIIWLISAFKSVIKLNVDDILISHHPYMSLFIAVALKMLGKSHSVKHYAFSFNHGNGLFFRGMLLWIARYVFKDTNGFVVYSQAERLIFNNLYNIDLDKISFCHWAVNPPEIKNECMGYIVKSKPYVCCMGRNNRDFDSFIKAMEKAKMFNAILVCPEGKVDASSLPDNVLLKNEIPFSEAMTILSNASVNVTPLKDASTGAGHITIVAAMQLGIPQLLTKLETIDDYFLDGQHGFFIEKDNSDSLVDKLTLLMKDDNLREKMKKNSISFSNKWLVEQAAVKFVQDYLFAIEKNEDLPKYPKGWE